MHVILYVGIFLSLLLALLLIVKKAKGKHDYLLTIWLIGNCCQLFFFQQNFDSQYSNYENLHIIGALLSAATSPLLYLYVQTLVRPSESNSMLDLIHFLPYMVMTLTIITINETMEDSVIQVRNGLIQSSDPTIFLIQYHGLLLGIINIIYPIIALRLLFLHRFHIESEFSNIDKINMNWLRYWILFSLTGVIISILIIWAGWLEFMPFNTSFEFIALSITLNIIVVGFFGLGQTTIFSSVDLGKSSVNPMKYKSSNLNRAEIDLLLLRLKTYMTDHKPYLNQQLSLDLLAEATGMNKHQLSQLINEKMGVNFYTFVNRYRMDEFKERLRDPTNKSVTLLGIAMDSGFSSKSSFQHIFKKMEGITPSQFQIQINESEMID